MLEFRTKGFNGYSVKYSPFFDSRIAVATAANFGLVGNGRLFILNLTANGIVAEKWFETQDALYDIAWSEAHENQAIVAAGDGSIKLYDITLNQFPIANWKEHNREVLSVHWNLLTKDSFLSSSWDGTIKVWNPYSPQSLTTIPTGSCTYSVQFSPHNPSLLSAVTSDSRVLLYDLRTPTAAQNHLVMGYGNHGAGPEAEVLSHDWNKYREPIIATGSVDRLIRTWDYRAPQRPVVTLPGHEYAVKRLSWSPHLADVLLSASYDMSCRVWTDGSAMGVGGVAEPGNAGARELGRMGRHTEFAMGVDWCLFGAEGWCASCAWDERILVWDVRATMIP